MSTTSTTYSTPNGAQALDMPSSASARRRRSGNNAGSSRTSTSSTARTPSSGPLPSKSTTRLERLLTLLLLSTLCLLSLHAYRLYARPYLRALASSGTYASPFASAVENVRGVFKLGSRVGARSRSDPREAAKAKAVRRKEGGGGGGEGGGGGPALKDVLQDLFAEDNSLDDKASDDHQGDDADAETRAREEGYSYGTLEDMLDAVYGKDRVQGEYALKKGDRFHFGAGADQEGGANAKQDGRGDSVSGGGRDRSSQGGSTGKKSEQQIRHAARKIAIPDHNAPGSPPGAAQRERERTSRFHRLAGLIRRWDADGQEEEEDGGVGVVADEVNRRSEL